MKDELTTEVPRGMRSSVESESSSLTLVTITLAIQGSIDQKLEVIARGAKTSASTEDNSKTVAYALLKSRKRGAANA